MFESAEALKIEAPDLYVHQSPVPNAYTLAINGHLKCDHGVWPTVANILAVGGYSIPGHIQQTIVFVGVKLHSILPTSVFPSVIFPSLVDCSMIGIAVMRRLSI
ncbi:peptidase family M48 protein [Tanacetum coccineum]